MPAGNAPMPHHKVNYGLILVQQILQCLIINFYWFYSDLSILNNWNEFRGHRRIYIYSLEGSALGFYSKVSKLSMSTCSLVRFLTPHLLTIHFKRTWTGTMSQILQTSNHFPHINIFWCPKSIIRLSLFNFNHLAKAENWLLPFCVFLSVQRLLKILLWHLCDHVRMRSVSENTKNRIKTGISHIW